MHTTATDPDAPRSRRRMFFAIVILAAVAAVALTALLINIFERKQEAKNPFYRVVELNDTIDDPAIWAKNFPLQYDLYTRTVDMERTKYGGSEAMPHSPTAADPRSVVARSKLEEDPRLKTIWAGYSFSADYRERRGHAYMLEDQTFTERQKFAPPAMCINCHASMVTTYLKLGDGDIMKGFNVISDTHMTYPQIRQLVKHPVACIDCHDPGTMQLRVTRPAFIEGIRALKASQDEQKIKGWAHPDSGGGLIKARHPEFEMWNQGVHARSGVACADCHMPYMRQGGLKISDHHVNSPLLKINRSCQTCHHFPEEELKARVEDIQDTFFNLRNSALDALVDLINDIKAEKAKGATDAQLATARDYQRRGQFMIDFVMSENSMGFHAPQEATRILGSAINLCRLGQLSLHGGPPPSHNPPNIENVASGAGLADRGQK